MARLLSLQATLRPLTAFSSGNLNLNLLTLWLTSAMSTSCKSTKPWSPPVNTFGVLPVSADASGLALLSCEEGGASAAAKLLK